MTSLYQKVNPPYYKPPLLGREASALRWRAMALLNLTPRLTRTREPVTDLIIYTDAETAAEIISAILIDPDAFRADRALSAMLSRRVGPRRKTLF